MADGLVPHDPAARAVHFDVPFSGSEHVFGATEEGDCRFKLIANALPHIIWTADPDFTVDWYNDWWFVWEEGGTARGESFPALVAPDVTFDERLTLRLDGETVELVELGRAGVSGNQTLAHAKNAGALFVGDLVHGNVHAWLEGGIVDGAPRTDIAGWKSILAGLAQRYPASTTVHGGRVDALPLARAVPWQTAYLDEADTLVADYVRRLGARKTELGGEKGGVHFAAMTKEFEAAFPGVGLSYMIQYGVYGLALSK